MPHAHHFQLKGGSDKPGRDKPGRMVQLGAALLGFGLMNLAPVPTVCAADATVTTVRSPNGEPWTISIRPARKASDTSAPRPLEAPVNPAPLVRNTIRQVAALSNEDLSNEQVPTLAEPNSAESPQAEPPLPTESVVEQARPKIVPANALPTPPEPGPEPLESPVKATPAQQPADEPVHTILITPGPSRSALVNGQKYSDVYRAIPFNRAEYNANPCYRHDATMEVLFGQMRPTTVVKHMPDPVVNEQPAYSPYKPFIPAYGDYWSARALPLVRPFFPGGLSSGDFSFRTTLPGADFPGGVRQGSALPPVGGY